MAWSLSWKYRMRHRCHRAVVECFEHSSPYPTFYPRVFLSTAKSIVIVSLSCTLPHANKKKCPRKP